MYRLSRAKTRGTAISSSDPGRARGLSTVPFKNHQTRQRASMNIYCRKSLDKRDFPAVSRCRQIMATPRDKSLSSPVLPAAVVRVAS